MERFEGGLSGKQVQDADVRLDDCEVASIECCYVVGTKPLGGSDHGCVDRSEREIAVLRHEFGDVSTQAPDRRRRHAPRLPQPDPVFDLDGLTMLIGPDSAARLLEIGVSEAEGVEFVVHAMPARNRFLET